MRFVRSMKYRPRLKHLLAVLITIMIGMGSTGFAEVGKSGWMIFNKAQGVNTRGVTSVVTNQTSLAATLYNPAVLGGRTRREAFFMSESGFAGDRFGGLLYGEPLKKGMIAGGLMGYDAGAMELNWIENGELKTESAIAQRDLVGMVSYGFPLRKNLFAGGTLKAASSEIAQQKTAYAVAGDLGLSYLPNKNLTVSAAVQNIGTSSKFIDQANPLPLSAYAGAGYNMKIKDYNLLAGAGVTYNCVDDTYIPEVGAELRWNLVSMSVGYKLNKLESALQLGLGINWGNVEFGYSYVPGIYLDTTHRLNMSYRFDGFFGKKSPAQSAAVKTKAVKVAAPKPSTTGMRSSSPGKPASTSKGLALPKSAGTAVSSTLRKPGKTTVN